MSAETIKEFLVGLGFEVDQAGLQKFTQGIASATLKVAAIGTAMTAAAAAVVAGVQAVASKYDDISKGENQFKELGISMRDAQGQIKPMGALFDELAGQLDGVNSEKAKKALELLGIDGDKLELFKDNLGELRDEIAAIDLASGLNLDDAVKESSIFMATWKAMQQEIAKWQILLKKTMDAIAVKIMPMVRTALQRVTQVMMNMRKVFMDNLPKIIATIEPVIKVVFRIVEAFIILVARVASALGTVIGWLIRVNDATNGWAGYILAAAAAWKYLNLAFLKTPLGMLLALATAVALLIDDFLTFKEGGDSLIDWGSGFGMVMQVVTSILAGVLAAMVALKVAAVAQIAWMNTVKAVTVAWNAVQKAAMVAQYLWNAAMMANPIGLVIAAVIALIAVVALIIANWDTVKEWFAAFVGWMVGIWDAVVSAISDAMTAAGEWTVSAFTSVKEWFTGFIDWIATTFSMLPEVIGGAFSAAKDSAIGIFTGVKDWFLGFFDWVMGKFAKLAEWGSKIKGFFGGGGAENAKQTTGGGGAPPLSPNPQSQSTLNGGNQNVNQQTQIVVNGSGDPKQTAGAVASAQNRVNADMARNMKGAAR